MAFSKCHEAAVLVVGALAMLGGFFDMGSSAAPLQLGP
jgi:hypothetical protein